MSANVKKNIKLPSRSPSQAAENKTEKDAKGGGAGFAVPTRFCCKFFLTRERKRGEDCVFAHLQQDAVNTINHPKDKAKAVGKAKPRAKTSAMPAPTGVTIPMLIGGLPLSSAWRDAGFAWV